MYVIKGSSGKSGQAKAKAHESRAASAPHMHRSNCPPDARQPVQSVECVQELARRQLQQSQGRTRRMTPRKG